MRCLSVNMTSLKSTLQNHIKSKYPNIVPYNEVIEIARSLGRKESNAERRLRESESSMIETIYNNGHITGYRYKADNCKIGNYNRDELVKTCVRMGCKTAEEILNHITCRTGIVFKESSEIDDKMASYLMNEFEINKPCYKS